MKKRKIFIVAMLLIVPVALVYGLGQRVAVQHIRGIGSDMNLSVLQVDGLTKQQANNYLTTEYPDLDADKVAELAVYFDGIKAILRADAVRRQVAANRVIIQNGFETLFPAVDIDWNEPQTERAAMVLAYMATGGDPNDL